MQLAAETVFCMHAGGTTQAWGFGSMCCLPAFMASSQQAIGLREAQWLYVNVHGGHLHWLRVVVLLLASYLANVMIAT